MTFSSITNCVYKSNINYFLFQNKKLRFQSTFTKNFESEFSSADHFKDIRLQKNIRFEMKRKNENECKQLICRISPVS